MDEAHALLLLGHSADYEHCFQMRPGSFGMAMVDLHRFGNLPSCRFVLSKHRTWVDAWRSFPSCSVAIGLALLSCFLVFSKFHRLLPLANRKRRGRKHNRRRKLNKDVGFLFGSSIKVLRRFGCWSSLSSRLDRQKHQAINILLRPSWKSRRALIR